MIVVVSQLSQLRDIAGERSRLPNSVSSRCTAPGISWSAWRRRDTMSDDRTSGKPPRDESSISGFHGNRRPTSRVRQRRNRNRNNPLQFISRCNLIYDQTIFLKFLRNCTSSISPMSISFIFILPPFELAISGFRVLAEISNKWNISDLYFVL